MSEVILAGLLDKAIILATTAHKGQVDKGGNPYILHPMNVASRVKTVKKKIVAWLHDVLEDTFITVEYLRKEGFTEEIIAAVVALTRLNGETYVDFCVRVSQNELAIDVKIEDINENMDFSRIVNPTEEDVKQYESRSERYKVALEILNKKKNSLKK